MEQRYPRYGARVYEVRVPASVAPIERLYFWTDSIMVSPSGVLSLSVEVPPLETEGNAAPGEIENAPVAILAPGQWLSCMLVTINTHEPIFSQDVWARLDAQEDEP